MTASIGSVFVVAVLAMIPFTLLFAGRDTDHRYSSRKECQRDALLDWTDKDRVSGEEREKKTSCGESPAEPGKVRIEVLTRDTLSVSAA